MGFSVVSKIIIGVFSVLKIALATAIIIIVSTELYKVTIYTYPNGNVLAYRTQCLMNGDIHGSDVCEYTFAVCGLSMLLSLVTSLLLCLTCDMCGLGVWLELIVSGFQTAWWVCASIVITSKVKDTNDFVFPDGSSVPAENWRNAVAVMSWVSALIAALTTIVCLYESFKFLAECCGCCGFEKKAKKDKKHKHAGNDGARPVDYQQGEPHAAPNPVGPPAAGGNDEATRATAV